MAAGIWNTFTAARDSLQVAAPMIRRATDGASAGAWPQLTISTKGWRKALASPGAALVRWWPGRRDVRLSAQDREEDTAANRKVKAHINSLVHVFSGIAFPLPLFQTHLNAKHGWTSWCYSTPACCHRIGFWQQWRLCLGSGQSWGRRPISFGSKTSEKLGGGTTIQKTWGCHPKEGRGRSILEPTLTHQGVASFSLFRVGSQAIRSCHHFGFDLSLRMIHV